MSADKTLGAAVMLVLADGTPVALASPLPVSFEGGITFPSSMTITNEIEIKNDAGNPLPVAFAVVPTVNVGTMPEIEIKNDAGNAIPVKGDVFRVSTPFTRPADTTAYAAGDLVANATAAGSVSPMVFALGCSDGLIRSAKFKMSNASLAAGSTFRLHLWSQAPTVTGGDNAAVFAAGAGLSASAGYLGYIDCTADVWFSDGAEGRGAPSPDIHFDLGAGTTVYGLLEARGAITPASAATITCTIAGLAA